MFTSPGGYLWQDAIKHGRSSRIYGEYLEQYAERVHAKHRSRTRRKYVKIDRA